MKQVLFILIIVSLISNLFALICKINEKLLCTNFNLPSCKCYPPNYRPNFPVALVQDCPNKLRSLCQGDATSLTCNCVM